MSKFKKCVEIISGEAAGKFQIGQTGKDSFGNLFRFKGVSKKGSNVWVHEMTFNHITKKYKSRYYVPKEALEVVAKNPDLRFKFEKKSKGYENDLKRMRAALKDKPLESTFKGKYGYEKDIRTKYYNVNRKSRILLDPAKQ